MKFILLSGLFLSLVSFIVADTDIVGLWESKTPRGNILGLRFRKDSTYEGFLNHKAFVSGPYTLNNDTLTLEDALCKAANGEVMKGIYKAGFYAPDSFRMEVITDSCTARSEDADYLRFGRVVKK
jgi:hypothetical protein